MTVVLSQSKCSSEIRNVTGSRDNDRGDLTLADRLPGDDLPK